MNRFVTMPRSLTTLASAAALTCLLAGCSSLEESKIDYKSASQAPTLQIPPDLTQLKRDSRYQVAGTNSASAVANATGVRTVNDAGTATNQAGQAQIIRTGNQRVLLIQRSADSVWEPLREFWKDNGFVLITDQPELGIMETDWAENRAKLPQDFIRKTVGKVFDSLYSTGERDRFRTRIERTDKGIEITITHRGMAEIYTSALKDQTVWSPRASDPELEIEFLRRLMLRLGGPSMSASASQIGAIAAAPNAAGGLAADVKIIKQNQLPAIEIKDGFDRAWRRVGVAIDRTGFTVEDRDRAQGVFFVRYAPPGSPDKEPGFFAKMFSSEKATPVLAKYRIAVTSKGDVSVVQVQAADGIPDTSANAEKIIKLLSDEIK
ncbi:MAG: outer membrane protein assembly factor BamC [Pseudomonadota bacterium]